jgi:hypothetical protein
LDIPVFLFLPPRGKTIPHQIIGILKNGAVSHLKEIQGIWKPIEVQ